MKLADVISKDTFLITGNFNDTNEFYHAFSELLKKKDIIKDHNKVRRLFIKREKIQSTAIGKGVATPHIFSEEFKDFFISVALIREGMPYKAPDGIDVKLVFLIMSNDRYVSFHLKSLANIARIVSKTNVLEEVSGITNEEELYDKIIALENSLENS